MKPLSYYESLPDYMPEEQIATEFRDLLSLPLSVGQRSIDTIRSLVELSERQWHTYKILCISIKSEVSRLLISMWDDEDADKADSILSITGNLGLSEVMEFLMSKSTDSFSTTVKKSVMDAYDEFGRTVADPYASA